MRRWPLRSPAIRRVPGPRSTRRCRRSVFLRCSRLSVIPQMLVQDTWLTLVSGREISLHGLPEVDGLTVWARGSTWIDQQWLAQLLFFWTHEVGGIKLVALAHVRASSLAIACAVARGEVARRVVACGVARGRPGDLRRAMGVPGACADVRDPAVRLARLAARRRQPFAVAPRVARLSAARPLGEPPRDGRPGQRRSLPCAGVTFAVGELRARKPRARSGSRAALH